MQPLPVDSLLPAIIDSLRNDPNLVIEAPPGAGKTTRVPPAILDGGLTQGREVWVLEPRRLAARMAARRVAEERGESAGETVGYQVRFEDVSGARTRLRFLTEGVFTRKLLYDPQLTKVGALILDEFHERHLQGDLALALARRLQQTSRPDLKIVAMSATLDAGTVASFLGDCPKIRSEGRRFDVDVEHLARPDDRPLELQVESAVRRLVAEGLDGDVLVFLPGAAEIRRAQRACEEVATRSRLLLVPLHGELPASEQDLALRPAENRKLILSTNVAESSVTIEGVVAVIDSGLARRAGHSPWSGLPTLNVARVSRASAVQRAGRAGRTRPGRCLRLYTAQDFAARSEHEEAEINRLDLAESALELHAAGINDLKSFGWFEPPRRAALEAADSLLLRLGAMDGRGCLTKLGRRMLRLPLHPRLARVVVEAESRGLGPEACLIAALIAERDIRARAIFSKEQAREPVMAKKHSPSDLLELSDLFTEAEHAGFSTNELRRMGLEPGAVRTVERVRRRLQRLVAQQKKERAPTDADTELLVSILAGYPDRVARRRESANESSGAKIELLLAGGGSADLAPESVVRQSEFMVAVDAEERREQGKSGTRGGRVTVRLASAIKADWLLDLFPEFLEEATFVEWNAETERVETVWRLFYDGLVLDESRATNAKGDEVSRVLAQAALEAGVQSFIEPDLVNRFLARCQLVSRAAPELDLHQFSDEDVNSALAALCEGRSSFAEVREAAEAGELLDILREKLSPEQSRALNKMAPERVTLARGRQVRVNYERGKAPWVASRLQDFFGMTDGPKVCGGRVPLVLHLLAPNQRAVQVTTDLRGFWERHYPALRRELGRRYPRHAWPENPLEATRGK